MRQLFPVFLLLCLCVFALPANAQILDDSTKQVYGVRTTRIFQEADVLNGRYDFPNPDTSLYNFHNERRWLPDTAYYQFLDNYGSAAQPLLWQMPWQIGVRPGKNVFDLYSHRPHRVEYFDTRSPFSSINYVNAGRGNQFIEARYARNVVPQWNLGFDYQRLAADRQIAFTNTEDETQINSYALAIHTNARSKNNRYRLLANFTSSKHEPIENGGIATTPEIFTDSLLDSRTEASRLTAAQNLDQRLGVHLFQQFTIFGEDLKVYHVLDQFKQVNRYRDEAISKNDSTGQVNFYPIQLNESGEEDFFSTTAHRTVYRHLENTVGLKGIRNRIGYGAFIKRRDARTEGWYTDEKKFAQHFAGGDLRLSPLDSLHLTGYAEKQLDGEDYRFRLLSRYRWVEVAQEVISVQPSLTEQEYQSQLFSWSNNFRNTVYTQTRASVHAPLNFIRMGVKLEARFISHKNLVYFNEVARPVQTTESGNLTQLTAATYNAFGKIKLRNRVTYSLESEPKLLRMPELFLNSQLYFEGPLFKNALLGQIGFELRYWSSYFPDAYMPATQQFYLQNEVESVPYPLTDFFINADIKTVTIFLKVNNLTYGLTNRNYFQTPYYPGFTRNFSFGFRWLFFD